MNLQKIAHLSILICTLNFNALAQVEETNGIKRIPGIAGYSTSYEIPTIPISRGGKLPESYSLKKFAPPVGDQMIYGTCVGWATTYAGMTILENIELNRNGSDLKEEDCMSPSLTYDLCKLDTDSFCANGTYVKAALNALVNFGSTSLSKYPYSCKLLNTNLNGVSRILSDTVNQKQVKGILATAKQKRLSGFISAGGPNIVQNVKYYLSQNMPVVIGAEMYQSIQRNSVSGVWNGAIDDFPGGHAMCVIGYDDNKEGGAFEILNSWGEEWSAGGYIWFRYNDFAKVVDEAFALKGIEIQSDSILGLNSFHVNLDAIGKNTSKTLEITKDQVYLGDYDFKIGGFENKLVINYPSNEQAYTLSIQNAGEEGFFVYAFSICCDGQVSFITPPNAEAKFYQGKGQGLMLPYDQQSAIPLTWNYSENSEFCILLSKRELQTIEIEESLERSYKNLEDFVRSNFKGEIAINDFRSRELLGGRINLKNSNEINDIQPIFFRCEEIEKDKSDDLNNRLFQQIEINGLEVLFLDFELERYKRGFLGDTYNLKIDIKKNYLTLGLNYRVNITMDKTENSYLDFLDEQNTDNHISFSSKKEDLLKNIQIKLLEYFVQQEINFAID